MRRALWILRRRGIPVAWRAKLVRESRTLYDHVFYADAYEDVLDAEGMDHGPRRAALAMKMARDAARETLEQIISSLVPLTAPGEIRHGIDSEGQYHETRWGQRVRRYYFDPQIDDEESWAFGCCARWLGRMKKGSSRSQ